MSVDRVDRRGRPLGIMEGFPPIVKNAEASPLITVSEMPSWVKELKAIEWKPEELIIADPLSYCAGVERANRAADQILAENPGETVYFYHAPIHNESKVNEWVKKGAKIVGSLDEVPDGSAILFSAHGISPDLLTEARRKKLRGMDATCPLVDKTHKDIEKFKEAGYRTLLIGKAGHDEIVGTLGHDPEGITLISPNISAEELEEVMEGLQGVDKLALSTQTTLSYVEILDLVEHIQELRPDIKLPNKDDICYATQNRQEAVIAAIDEAGAQMVVVFGSDETKGKYKSNNSIELRETAKGKGVGGYLAEDWGEVKAEWFRGVSKLGVSAGASAAPERIVELIAGLRELGLRNDQINRVTVAYEDQLFKDSVPFDYSQQS